MRKEYRIFMASSTELAEEHRLFEKFIKRENKRLADKHVLLHLEVWEDRDDAITGTSKQKDYNHSLRSCSLCVVLFWTRVGKYTHQEFDLAYQLYKETGWPRMYVYEKTATAPRDPLDWEAASKKAFREKINLLDEEQFQNRFGEYLEFENKFKRTLDDLFRQAILSNGTPTKTIYTDEQAALPPGFEGRDEEFLVKQLSEANAGETANTDNILEVLYDFSTLTETERYWLVNMALLPTQNHEAYLLEELWGFPEESICETYLEPLARKGWLISGNNTYRLSPVLQPLVLKKNTNTSWEDAKNLVARFAKLLELEQEKDNILSTKARWASLALPLLIGVEGSNEPVFSAFLNNLALVLKAQGGEQNLKHANDLLERVLASDIENFGETASTVAISQSNLALVLQDMGGEHNLKRARDLLEKALVSASTNDAVPASTVAGRQSNLAMVYMDLGGEHNLNIARYLLELALTSNIQNFGETASVVAVSQSNLALVLQDLGGEQNLTHARELLERALASNMANFGEASPGLVIGGWNLFAVCLASNSIQEAVRYLLYIYPLSEKYLPDTHPLKQMIKDQYDQFKEEGY